MKTIKFFAVLIFATAFLQAEGITAKRQVRDLSGFIGVEVSNGIDLYLDQQNVEKVSVEAEPDDIDKIITEVKNGVLKIYVKEKKWLKMSKKHRKVYVSMKTIELVDASSGADVSTLSSMKADKLQIRASSGSDIKMTIEANELTISSSSGSDVEIEGTANFIGANASSGSEIEADKLRAKRGTADASSGASITMFVTENIDADASSGGNIIFIGNPTTKSTNTSSGGSIKAK